MLVLNKGKNKISASTLIMPMQTADLPDKEAKVLMSMYKDLVPAGGVACECKKKDAEIKKLKEENETLRAKVKELKGN